jgi:hypothetical protein
MGTNTKSGMKEPTLNNKITDLPKLNGDKGSSGTGNNKGNRNSKGSSEPKIDGSGQKPSGSSSSTTFDNILENALKDYKKYNSDMEEQTSLYNKNQEESRQFIDGKSDEYISLGTLMGEKHDAEDKLREAEKNNPKVVELQNKKAQAKDAKKAVKQKKELANSFTEKMSYELGLKKTELEAAKSTTQQNNQKNDPKYLQGQLDENKRALDSVNTQLQLLEENKEWLDAPKPKDVQKKVQDLYKQQTELGEKRKQLTDALANADPNKIDQKALQEIGDQLSSLAQTQLQLNSGNVDALIEWANDNGSEDLKTAAEALRKCNNLINEAFVDGGIDPNEMKDINKFIKSFDTLIKEERKQDPEIMKAQKGYDSAKSKYLYYLFDTIASTAVFLVSLSQGSPQMVYSALSNWNKGIAEAENRYQTNQIAAFSSNDVKNITGKADSQYIRETFLPELEKNIYFKRLGTADQAAYVKALETAFEEYQNYTSKGGNEDFAVWYTMQTQKQGDNGWAGLLNTLIQAGALNWDNIKKFLGDKAGENPIIDNKKKTSMFQGSTGSILNSALTNTEKQTAQIMARDKASILQSGLGRGQPSQTGFTVGQNNNQPGWNRTFAG